MPESGGANIEVARHLTEKSHGQETSNTPEILEVLEAIVLALVAVTTAWSGYQAARWDGRQSVLYGQSSRLRIEAQGLHFRGTQAQVYDAATVAEWLKASAHNDTKLANLFERRLLPDFRPAFEAWKQTDPLNNANAPAAPMEMPQYRNPTAEEAALRNSEASELFEQGTQARERADEYVRVTVTLATVLLLAAISQKFHVSRIRAGLLVLAFLLLLFPLWRVVTLPRA